MDGEISPVEVAALLDEDVDLEVVDIRDRHSFRSGHIPGSRNVPFGDLPDQVTELDGAERVVTVCPHGKASVQAARLAGSYEGLADATVESMEGGLEAWREEHGYDLVSADAGGETSTADAGASEGPEAPF